MSRVLNMFVGWSVNGQFIAIDYILRWVVGIKKEFDPSAITASRWLK